MTRGEFLVMASHGSRSQPRYCTCVGIAVAVGTAAYERRRALSRGRAHSAANPSLLVDVLDGKTGETIAAYRGGKRVSEKGAGHD